MACPASPNFPASYNYSMGKEIFLRRPPSPFDCGLEGGERRRRHDTDEDWLPTVKDIFSCNVHVMIDMTKDSDSEDDAESFSRYPRSVSGADPATAKPTRSQPSPCGERPLWVAQPPKAVTYHNSEQAEIPESPNALQGFPAMSVTSPHRRDGDSGEGSAATTAIPEAVAAYTEEDSSVEEQQDHARARSTSSVMLSAREVAHAEGGSYISVQDVTFLRVEGQREAAGGPEYQCVTEIWLRPGAGIPSDLLHAYRRDATRQARLTTLRTRKRMSEEVGVVKVKRCVARKKVSQAQVERGLSHEAPTI